MDGPGGREHGELKGRSPYPCIAAIILLAAFSAISSYPLGSSPNEPEPADGALPEEQADREESNGESSGIGWITDLAEGQGQARKAGKPLLAYFYSEFCYWCKKLDAEVFSNTKIVELSKQLVFVRINADKNTEIALRHSVKYLPSMVFFSPDGRVENAVVGFQDQFQLLGLLYEALN